MVGWPPVAPRAVGDETAGNDSDGFGDPIGELAEVGVVGGIALLEENMEQLR